MSDDASQVRCKSENQQTKVKVESDNFIV